MFVDILDMSRGEIDAMRASTTPNWATRIAAAHTLPRECRVEESWVYRPGEFDAITAPTLLLAGSDTPADLSKATHAAADAIPDTRIRVLEGHGHMAHKTDPAMVATIVRQFILSEPGPLASWRSPHMVGRCDTSHHALVVWRDRPQSSRTRAETSPWLRGRDRLVERRLTRSAPTGTLSADHTPHRHEHRRPCPDGQR